MEKVLEYCIETFDGITAIENELKPKGYILSRIKTYTGKIQNVIFKLDERMHNVYTGESNCNIPHVMCIVCPECKGNCLVKYEGAYSLKFCKTCKGLGQIAP